MRTWPIFVALMATSSLAHAGDKPLIGQALPTWVKPVAAPPIIAPGDGPLTVVLADQQVRLERTGVTVFSKAVVRINNAQGLAAGNISLPWRPDVGDLSVHQLVIRRGDKAIDVLKSGQTFTVVRREANLESAMLDGVLTANIQPEGLQVGDMLELVTSVTSRDPVMGGQVEQALPLGGLVTIGRASVRASWPTALPVRWQTTGGLAPPKSGRAGEDRWVELSLDNLAPFTPPKLAPARYQIGRTVELSAIATWAELSALLAPLYTKAAVLPSDGPLAEEVARIRAGSTDPKVRAAAALALVQERIRYVALAMGAGGLVPADVATTWGRRYGDCKAKTAMLLAILRALDIRADPVAVSTVLGDGVDQRLPMVGAFDHVLVRATIDGKVYWLDGTRMGDTTLDRLDVPGYGWGLPLIAEGGGLVRMTAQPLTKPAVDTDISIDATRGLTVPAPVTVTQTMRGDGAVGLNAALSNLTAADRDRALREMWKRQYDFIDADRTNATFDPANRELKLTLDGKARMDWSTGWYETDGLGLGYKADLTRQPGYGQDAPFAVGHPTYVRNTETIRLPPGFPAQSAIDKIAINQTVGGVEYRRSGTIENRVFRAEASARSIAPEFPAREAPAVEAALRDMEGKTVYIVKPAGYVVSDAELDSGGNAPTTGQAWRVRGGALLDRGRHDEAIAAFGEALKLDPKDADALSSRGLAHVWKTDYASAERDLAAAEALAPRHVIAMRARALAAEQRGELADSFARYSKVLEAFPNDGFGLWHRADVAVRLGKRDAALADLNALRKPGVSQPDLELERFNILRSLGRRDEAYQVMRDAASKAAPDDELIHVMAGKAFASLGRKDEALAEFDRALAIKPDAYVYLNRAEIRPASDVAGRIADLDMAIKLDPQMPEASVAKADLLMKQGKFAEAIGLYDKAVASSPKDATILTRRGITRSLAGQRVEADRDLTAARGLLDPKDSRTLNSMCWLKATAGAVLESALADCDASLAISPNSPATIDSRAFVLLRLGRFDDAIAAYSTALASVPDQASSLYGRGIALTRKGEKVRGEQDLARARSIQPSIDEEFARYGIKAGT